MVICIDYDETYTKDPYLWQIFIVMAQHRGHEVICCTMRTEEEAEDLPLKLREQVTVYATSRKAKKDYLSIRGINPGVWIDDSPYWVLNDALPVEEEKIEKPLDKG